MSTQNWLTLMEYSAKFRVSLSTLRRRIKSGELEHKFVDGKYLLKDGPLQTTTSGSETIAPPTSVSSQIQSPVEAKTGPASNHEAGHDPHWKTTQTLLAEIKKAYALVLQEKEEQILQLKEELADLKTLVRVLEETNERMKDAPPMSMDFDLGLEA